MNPYIYKSPIHLKNHRFHHQSKAYTTWIHMHFPQGTNNHKIPYTYKSPINMDFLAPKHRHHSYTSMDANSIHKTFKLQESIHLII